MIYDRGCPEGMLRLILEPVRMTESIEEKTWQSVRQKLGPDAAEALHRLYNVDIDPYDPGWSGPEEAANLWRAARTLLQNGWRKAHVSKIVAAAATHFADERQRNWAESNDSPAAGRPRDPNWPPKRERAFRAEANEMLAQDPKRGALKVVVGKLAEKYGETDAQLMNRYQRAKREHQQIRAEEERLLRLFDEE